MNTRSFAASSVLNGITALAVLIALYLALVYAPPAANLVGAAQMAQRIFYFHVPSAWVGFLAFFVTFVASITYLWRGGRQWDILALSSVEIGLVFTTMVVITGPLWAKPTWGVWWVWADPKLSTVAVLWLIYFAYLMLRNTVEGEARRARLAAVLGIVGFIDVPIVFGAVRWWGQSVAHPIVFGTGGLRDSLRMLTAFLFCLGTFTLLYVVLLIQRVRLEGMRHEVERLKSRITNSRITDHGSRIVMSQCPSPDLGFEIDLLEVENGLSFRCLCRLLGPHLRLRFQHRQSPEETGTGDRSPEKGSREQG